MGSPVIFKQECPGLHGNIFKLPELFCILNGCMSCVGDGDIKGTTKKNLDFTRLELNPLMRFLRWDIDFKSQNQ